MTELMNVTTVAKKLGKRRPFVDALIASGRLAGIDLTEEGKRRDIRVTPDALEDYLASAATVPPVSPQRGRRRRKQLTKGKWL